MKQKYILVQGATLKCRFGNTSDTLLVKTHAKEFANDPEGREKPIATTKETGSSTLKNNSFGSCSQLGSPPPPCKVNITEWIDFYPKITLSNEGKVLLECSSAICALAGTPCISVVNHGQIVTLSKQNFKNADTEVMTQLNPLADSKKMLTDTDESEILKKLIQAE
jgi:hypothetical protein